MSMKHTVIKMRFSIQNEECSWDCTERSTEVGGYVQ